MKIRNNENQALDELSELCGREVDREFRLQLIKEAEETGEPLAKIADKYAMPPTVILNDDKTFEFNGEIMNVAEFQRRWPYRRIVTIGLHKNT